LGDEAGELRGPFSYAPVADFHLYGHSRRGVAPDKEMGKHGEVRPLVEPGKEDALGRKRRPKEPRPETQAAGLSLEEALPIGKG